MILESVKVDTGESAKTVKELRAELKSLRDTLLNTAKGTEEYNKAMVDAANIQHDLKEQMEEINASAMDFGQKLGNVTKAFTGVAGGITAATGALSLFGVENEEAQKKITATMTSLIGITQGLAKIDSGIKAFKRLNIILGQNVVVTKLATAATNAWGRALIATGIGAFIVLVGSLIAHWDDLTAAMKRWGIIADDTSEKQDEINKKHQETIDKLRELEEAYEEWTRKNDVSKLNKKSKESYDELTKSIEDYQKQLDILVEKQKLTKSSSEWNALNEEGKQLKEQIRLLKGQQDAIVANKDNYKELKDEVKKVSDEVYDAWVISSSLEKVFNRQKKSPWEVEIKPSLPTEEEVIPEVSSFIDTVNKLIQNKQKDNPFNLLGIDLHNINAEIATIENAMKLLDTTNEIQLGYYQELEERKTELMKEGALKRQQIREQELNSSMSVFTEMGILLENLGSLMEEGTKEQKAMATAAATIQMLVGITTALSGAFTTKSGPWDIALAAVQAASIAASGAVNIKKINEVSTSGGSTVVPSINLNSVVGASQDFNYSVDGASTQKALTDQKVYVTEHDITTTQTKVRVAQSRATY